MGVGAIREELHGDPWEAFTGVGVAVGVGIEEDEVADADEERVNGAEAEVDGEVPIGVVLVVGSEVGAGFEGGVGGEGTAGQGDGGSGDAVALWERIIEAVFPEVVIASGASARDGLELMQGSTSLEVGGWNVEAIGGGVELGEEVAAVGVGGLGADGKVRLWILGGQEELHGDVRGAFAYVVATVAVGVDEEAVAEGERELEAEVDGEVEGGVDIVI